MQITRKQLKQIISEEMEKISNEDDKLETLVENYAKDYATDEDNVSKQALIDFLEVMSESKIPKDAFISFMQNLPEESVTEILNEVVTEE